VGFRTARNIQPQNTSEPSSPICKGISASRGVTALGNGDENVMVQSQCQEVGWLVLTVTQRLDGTPGSPAELQFTCCWT
jgi:hypothetical protein